MEIGTVVNVLGLGFGGAIVFGLIDEVAKWRTGCQAAAQSALQQGDVVVKGSDVALRERDTAPEGSPQ